MADLCSCGSGAAYRDCCRRFHVGDAEPPSPADLMRARFCAFARKEVDFLMRTLHPEHEDRAHPAPELRRAIKASCDRYRYVRLAVLDASEAAPGDDATVRFRAELFEKGKPRGFTETSVFRHDGTGWRYLRGDIER